MVVLMGVTLGLIGGGGSLFTVPVLVYIFGLDSLISGTYSHFMVGVTTLFGFSSYWQKKAVSFTTGVLFLVPSVTAVFLAKVLLWPLLPDTLMKSSLGEVTKDRFVLLLTALLMLWAAFKMRKTETQMKNRLPYKNLHLILSAVVIGLFTAVIGIGGGFLIVPALLVFGRLSMNNAVGTALFIVFVKSIIGFTIDMDGKKIDWYFLLTFSGFGLLGMQIGIYLSEWVAKEKLKTGFAFLLFGTGILILYSELIPH
jgi:uncharacterized membrane protein YfcA